MIDPFVLLTPVLALGVLSLVRFIGCNQVFGLSDTDPLVDPPTNLQAIPADGRIDLTWDYDNGDATRFELLSHDSGGGAYTVYPNPDVVVVTHQGRQHGSAAIPNLTNGVTYYFKVRAYIGTQISSDSQEAFATPGVTAYLNLDTPGNLRNDLSGWVGMTIQVGPSDLVVTQLGRLVVANNVSSHDVKIVDPAAANQVLATVTINMPAGPVGDFAYGSLSAPVKLTAFHLYYVVTREQSGGDAFLDILGMSVTTTNAALITSAVYSVDPSPDTFLSYGSPNQLYGPVNFRY